MVNKLVNNKSIFSLFIVLALILVITSSIVCYTIGRNSGVSENGKIIDTIIIEEPQNTDKLPVYLTGKVSYSDGTPYEGKIQFFSEIQQTNTNKNGVFFFQNIVYGKHSLLIVDDNGKTISEISLKINQSTKADLIIINKIKTGYEVSVGINNSLIEINIEIDKETKEISLNEKKLTTVNYNGNVITSNKKSTVGNQIIETFNGNKVMPEGIIVLPNIGVILSNGTFISNTGTGQINYPKGITRLPNNFNVGNDGTIKLPDKTVIKPDGTIIRPKTEETKPVSGEDEETDNKDPLSWKSPIVKQGNMRWDQLTTIELFSTNDSELDGKIYPGVSGEYEFNIENANPYNVLFSIDMEEQEHEAGSINLSYRLKYYDDDLNKYVFVIGDNNNYLKPSELSTTDKVTLSANSNVTYILEWTWANENNKEQDLRDGKIGTSNNKVHCINMTINIENA